MFSIITAERPRITALREAETTVICVCTGCIGEELIKSKLQDADFVVTVRYSSEPPNRTELEKSHALRLLTHYVGPIQEKCPCHHDFLTP